MPLERTALEPSQLSDGIRKVLAGVPAAKMMAARGLAPLKPGELLTVLYHLAIGDDAPLKAAADKAIVDLPEKTLGAAFADATLDRRVLDYFSGPIAGKPVLVEALLLNRATDDVTVLDLVYKLGEKQLEMVAVNEQRLLRTPAIIGALYMNPKARMSTVDRLVELAIRNDIKKVPGIKNWDNIVEAVTGDQVPKGELAEVPDEDDVFAAVAARVTAPDSGEFTTVPAADADDELLEVINKTEDEKVDAEKKELRIDELSISAKIRLATLGNAFARAVLIRDSKKMVALAAINSPGMTDNEVVKFSANRSLAAEVMLVIAREKGWTKIYKVKVNLVNNPKCAISESMRFLPFLHEKDLRNLSRSKGVPSAITQSAKRLLQNKSGAKKD